MADVSVGDESADDESADDESADDESADDESAGKESATLYPHLLKNVSFFINFIVCQFYLLNADNMAVLPPSLMGFFFGAYTSEPF